MLNPNFLTASVRENFDLNETLIHGWKHFFGSRECMPFNDETLFITIVRDPVQWLLSFYKEKNHLDTSKIKDLASFIRSPVVSYSNHEAGEAHPQIEVPEDHHIFSRRRYEDIFDFRAVKALFFLDHLPKRVKHSILLRKRLKR